MAHADTNSGPRIRRLSGFRRGRKRRIVVAAMSTAVCLLMTVAATPASANWGLHESFGEGVVRLPVGVAVDQSSGDVYVGSLIDSHIDKFDPTGALLSPPSPFGPSTYYSGVAVNPANQRVYALDAYAQDVEIFASTGEAVGAPIPVPGAANLDGLFATEQIATDAHGDVYVPIAPENKVAVFNEQGEATGTITGLEEPEGVAVGPSGNVWVADTGADKIAEFAPNEEEVGGKVIIKFEAVTSSLPKVAGLQAVALDGSGDVFASIGGAMPYVNEYSPSGTVIAEKIGEGILNESEYGTPNGISFDRAREILYVADGGDNVIQRFTDWAVTTKPATDVEEGKAQLNGEIEVEPGASIASCRFEYGPTAAYGSSVPCEKPGGGGGPYTTDTTVSATVSGRSGDVHYRIAVTNASGEYKDVGADQLFGPPAIDSQYVDATVTTARAHAKLTVLEAGASTCMLEYGLTTAYGQSVPCAGQTSSEPGTYDAEAEMRQLQPDATYHYRFVTENRASAGAGSDGEFSTFGVSSFAFEALGQDNGEVTQAGAHPYDVSDKFALNTSTHAFVNGATDVFAPDANEKDIITELPPGLIGNPDATPKCTAYDVVRRACTGAAQVGLLVAYTANPGHVETEDEPLKYTVPLYNLLPPKGVAAQFGANIAKVTDVRIDARVRTGADYGVTAEVINGSADEGIVGAEVTLWGVPAAESHDKERYCLGELQFIEGQVPPCTEHGPLTAFLTNPTACDGGLAAHMSVDSWQEPSIFVDGESKMPAVTGCGSLHFAPSMTVTPTSKATDSPSGLSVELDVPQNEDPNGLATPDLKDAKVTLPAGMTVNPSSANGLAACPLLSGKEGHPGVSGIDLENGEGANCPNTSKIGSVRIKTPLLEEELEGGVYVAQQNANPFKSLLALYITAEAPERGVVVKLAGHVELNPTTGQLTTTFDENPQLPFEVLKLDFFGGERAALATPRTCGSFQAAALLEPYSHQGAPGEEGTPNAEPSIDPFEITSGPGGTACGSSPFGPGFAAGMSNNHGGSYSSFVMNLTRNDGEQRFSTVAMTLPPGISGMISKLTPCANAQAEAGDCSAASKIGQVSVQAGVGNEPVTLPEAGKGEDPVYLTERYEGAPFGLSIVVPAQAGPFNLGTVVVRAKIEVNPRTAQVSVVSNPMPTMLQGIPLDVKAIHVEIDRPEFMFNPTSCESRSVTGAIGSAEDASAAVSSHFQAGSCATLAFKPKFSAEIGGHPTRRHGEFLHVHITSAFGQANVGRVYVALPKQLPSELATLNLACTEEQFKKNPEACPQASKVGHAVAHTPILPVPLEGPAIFVSHGGRGFPDLELVLKGDGVSVTLEGETYINKAGVTSSTFASVPDVPVSSFELMLPSGEHPALAANGNVCAQPLYMPTKITAQNGAVVEQKTTIKVANCKPELQVRKHKVSGQQASIVVHVPSAGKLTASGKGIAGASKKAGKAKLVSLTVKLTSKAQRTLAQHRHRRIRVLIHLRFKPQHGKAISGEVAVLMH